MSGPRMADELSGLRVAYFTTDEDMEQLELTAPRQTTPIHLIQHVYYGAVVVRGGVTDFDMLRIASAAVSSFQELPDADKPAPGQRVLVEADVVRGRTRTPWPSMRTDIIENASGIWVETSRHPGKMPPFWDDLTRVFSRQSRAPYPTP